MVLHECFPLKIILFQNRLFTTDLQNSSIKLETQDPLHFAEMHSSALPSIANTQPIPF